MLEDRIRNVSLVELVRHSNASVRLTNCISCAEETGRLPFHTVGEYLDAGNTAFEEIMKIQNLGRRSAGELDGMVKEFINDPDVYFGASMDSVEEVTHNSRLEEFLQNPERVDSLSEVEWNIWKNAVCDSSLSDRRISEILVDVGYEWPQSRFSEKLSDYCIAGFNELLSIPGIGRLKRRYIVIAFGLAAREAQTKESLSDENSGSEGKERQPNDNKYLLEEKINPNELFEKSLKVLTEREREIILKRYGMNDRPRETLETLGQHYNVTRERIRQIESVALKKLKRGQSKAAIELFINNSEQIIYQELTGGDRVILRSQLSERERSLSGEFRCALEVIYESVERWLDSVARATPSGWYMYPCDPEDISNWEVIINDYCSKVALPRPVDSLVKPLQLATDQLEIALGFMEQFRIFSGYLIKGNSTPRKRRCIHAHQLMSHIFKRKPATTEQIQYQYHIHYPSDQCSTRDLDIVLSDAPHLFVNLNESGWMAIGMTCATQKPSTVVDETATNDSSELLLNVEDSVEEKEGETLFQIVYKMVEDEGPMAFITARERFTEIAGDRYSPNSVFPTLITNTAFVRMAPGIIGTKSQLDTVDSLRHVSPLLLRSSQCKIYVLARAAGTPRIEYPLWTPAMEHTWCKWAGEQDDKALFHSLLAVVEPMTWPTSDTESNWWLDRKEREGHYQLETKPSRLDEKVPDPDDLYAVLMYAYAVGSVNWMVANRVIGCRIDDHHIISILALLVATKALCPIGGWQECHKISSEADNVVMRLEKERSERGFIEWSALGINGIDVPTNCARTWVQSDALRNLTSKILPGEEYRTDTTYSSGELDIDSLDEMMKRHKQHRIEEQLKSYVNSEDS